MKIAAITKQKIANWRRVGGAASPQDSKGIDSGWYGVLGNAKMQTITTETKRKYTKGIGMTQKENGNDPLSESEQDYPCMSGGNSPSGTGINSDIIKTLQTRKGRDKLRRILGPALPGVIEEGDDDTNNN